MNTTISLGVIETKATSGRSERRDAAANRELILMIAEKLFAERGVANVCMSEIAQAAGIGKGTLYRRFANKGELCLALLDSQLREFQDRALTQMQWMTVQQQAYLAQLSEFLVNLVQFNLIHMPLLNEVQQHQLPIPVTDISRPHYWQYLTVYGLLQAAARQGELPAGLDNQALAEALLAPLSPFIFRYQLDVLGFSAERITAALQTLLMGLPHSQ